MIAALTDGVPAAAPPVLRSASACSIRRAPACLATFTRSVSRYARPASARSATAVIPTTRIGATRKTSSEPSNSCERSLDRFERIAGSPIEQHRLGPRLEHVRSDVRIDVPLGRQLQRRKFVRECRPVATRREHHDPRRPEIERPRSIPVIERKRVAGHAIRFVPAAGPDEDVAGAGSKAGPESQLEADPPRVLEGPRVDLQALLEAVGLDQEEGEVVLDAQQRLGRP